MPLIKTQWNQLDESWFFMVRSKRSGWQRAEWSNQGEVQLRQIYEGKPAQFFAIVDDRSRGEKTVLGSFGTLHEAQLAVEAHFEVHKDEVL